MRGGSWNNNDNNNCCANRSNKPNNWNNNGFQLVRSGGQVSRCEGSGLPKGTPGECPA